MFGGRQKKGVFFPVFFSPKEDKKLQENRKKNFATNEKAAELFLNYDVKNKE